MKDESSPILDFYPTQFSLDPNGHRQPWLWIALLPFIDAERLLEALETVEKDFTLEEKFRNTEGVEVKRLAPSHPPTHSLTHRACKCQRGQLVLLLLLLVVVGWSVG